MRLPDTEEIEAFEERVSEVSRLVDGLRSGALSAEYVGAQQARCWPLCCPIHHPVILHCPDEPVR